VKLSNAPPVYVDVKSRAQSQIRDCCVSRRPAIIQHGSQMTHVSSVISGKLAAGNARI